MAAFLWAEIEARARRLLREVHILATAYGWTEAEVLSLGENRRARYVERVQSGAATCSGSRQARGSPRARSIRSSARSSPRRKRQLRSKRPSTKSAFPLANNPSLCTKRFRRRRASKPNSVRTSPRLLAMTDRLSA
jgi:hypothetical protein